MYKFILIISCFCFMLILLSVSECSSVYAEEVLSRSERVQGTKVPYKRGDSCTERCHVNYMAYESKFEATQRAEMFRHKTHSYEQNLDCTSCHDNSEVNTEGHGKLTIKQENCLKCHHVELKESACKRCHIDIDENPMKYKEENFIHGFTVESDVDCGLCHIKDPNASLKDDEINCVKCHHTTPDLDCANCHKNDLDKYHDTTPEKVDSLSWSVTFKHSQHQEQELSCKACHSVNHEVDSGIDEYKQNCSKCHHASEEIVRCTQCHMEPNVLLLGNAGIDGVALLPDMMSRSVKCEDCHKYNEEVLKFKGVGEYCIECHNRDYGKLYSAWIKTIEDRLEGFSSRIQLLIENDMKITDNNMDNEVKEQEQMDMDIFLEKTGSAVDLITKYGAHNFNLTINILDSLEEGLEALE